MADWNNICNQVQSLLVQSCGDLVYPDGTLTQAGQTAVGCIRNGVLLGLGGLATGLHQEHMTRMQTVSWIYVISNMVNKYAQSVPNLSDWTFNHIEVSDSNQYNPLNANGTTYGIDGDLVVLPISLSKELFAGDEAPV